MSRTPREQKLTTSNNQEPSAGWVRAYYVRQSDGRWTWSHRSGVFASPEILVGRVHRWDMPPILLLVRQFPHRLNDVVEIPIWP